VIHFLVTVDEPPYFCDAAVMKATLLEYLSDNVVGVVPLAEVGVVQPKYGDPEAFGEREAELFEDDVQKLPYGTKLYAAGKP
jgi:hypothetical protein